MSAPTETLFQQASMTAEHYMYAAISAIDKAFDQKGYAAKHPELVGAFMHTCALDFLCGQLTACSDSDNQINRAAQALEDLSFRIEQLSDYLIDKEQGGDQDERH